MHLPFATVLAAALVAVTLGMTKTAPEELEVRADIHAFGTASFLVESGDDWRQSWVVTCDYPLRDCIARSEGAVLRLDTAGQPWLLISTNRGATLILRDIGDPASAMEVTELLSRPITPYEVAELSEPGAALALVTGNGSELLLRMQGIAHVVNYLQWLASPTARGLRDARHWTADGIVDLENLDAFQLERYRVLKLREAT